VWGVPEGLRGQPDDGVPHFSRSLRWWHTLWYQCSLCPEGCTVLLWGNCNTSHTHKYAAFSNQDQLMKFHEFLYYWVYTLYYWVYTETLGWIEIGSWYLLFSIIIFFKWFFLIGWSLFSWRYNPLWLYFHSPVAGFSLLVFKVSWSHTTTHHSR